MASTSQGALTRKIQRAVNSKLVDKKVLLTVGEFYSVETQMTVPMYTIRLATLTKNKYNRPSYGDGEVIFKTSSSIQATLFLRDMYNHINGWEVPHDNAYWEMCKQKYREKVGEEGSKYVY